MPEPASATFLRRAFELLPATADELGAVVDELPALGIVARLVVVIDRAAADPRIGRVARDGEPIAGELAAIAAAIQALWGPRGAWDALVLRLAEPGARERVRAASPSVSARGDDAIAWEPMEDDDLAALVARSPAPALAEALASFAPLGLYCGCLATAVLLRAAEPESRLTLAPPAPHARVAEHGAHRALVLAELARLRRTLERGLPGVVARLQAPARHVRRTDAGPYRAHVASSAEASPPSEAAPLPPAPDVAAVDPAAMADLFAEAHERALAAAVRDRAAAAIDEERRTFFRAESAKVTEQHAAAERAALPLIRARGVHRVIQRGLFPVALHEAIVELHAAAGGLAVEQHFAAESTVKELGRCGRALDAIAKLLAFQLEISGDLTALTRVVAGHLAMANPRPPATPYEQLVDDVAAALRGTAFASLHASLPARMREVEDADREAAAADARVHWYERLPLLGATKGVMERDAHDVEAARSHDALATAHASVRGYVEGALRALRPRALSYFRTFDLRATLAGVHVVEVPTIYAREDEPRLVGDVVFREQLEAWTGETLGAFGHLPSPGEVFERCAAAALDGARRGS